MIRAFQWDLARQVERLDFLEAQLPRYAEWGYQELYLHLEDAVQYPSLPGIGRADAYTYEELGALVVAAARVGIRVVPVVNLLGHTQYLIKHPDLRDLNELRDERGDPLASGQICPLHPRTLEVAAHLLNDVIPFCTAGKVHVGLDESFHLGKCPRCREEVARIGLDGHFAGHVSRLHGLALARGLQLGLWADMLYFIPKAIPQLPRGIIAYDWYYYPFQRRPRVEFFNFVERDLFPALARQGIQYYGCPMNGAFRHEPLPVFGDRLANIRSWWERCETLKADGFLVTSWEAYRLALETTIIVDAAAANLWLEPAHSDATSMLTRGLARTFGAATSARQARALLTADSHAFAGYARWQINDRWDRFAGRESIKPYLAELRLFERLLDSSYHWPAPLAASLEFRRYIAQRDVFVRAAARAVFRCRQALRREDEPAVRTMLEALAREARDFVQAIKGGSRAARTMWRRTRLPADNAQNDLLLAADARRLADWRRWLAQAKRQPRLVTGASTVAGAWQLQFDVHNFAPAVTRLIVEECGADGVWREIASRYTIEFRASAARPHARIRREFTVPVTDRASSLRLRVGGVGAVGISHVTLTDGCVHLTDQRFRAMRRLGRRAPSRGLPDPKQVSTPVALRFR